MASAGIPITIWGSAAHDYGHRAEGDAVIKFSFNGIEKTIPVKDSSLPQCKANGDLLKAILLVGRNSNNNNIADLLANQDSKDRRANKEGNRNLQGQILGSTLVSDRIIE